MTKSQGQTERNYRYPFPGYWRTVFKNGRFWHLIVNKEKFFPTFARDLKNYNFAGKPVISKSF